jgi:hypothetical protein
MTNKNNFPEIKIYPMKDTLINVKNPKEYNILMEIYEKAGLKWYSDDTPPTKVQIWNGKDMCISIEEDGFIWQSKFSSSKRIISLDAFCNEQDISKEKLKNIRKIFQK